MSYLEQAKKAKEEYRRKQQHGVEAERPAVDQVLADALAAIIKPIVKEAIREAMNLNSREATQPVADKSFLTIKQAAETSGLGASTIRLAIRKRQLRAQRVGRRVLVKRSDLEKFLEANPIAALPDENP